MAVFSILLKAPDARVEAALAGTYAGSSVSWTPTHHFLKTADSALDVGAKLGMRSDALPNGIGDIMILKLSPSYWGWAPQDLWAWLQAAFESQP